MNRMIVNTHPEQPLEFNLWIQTRLSIRMEWLEINPKVAGSSSARGTTFRGGKGIITHISSKPLKSVLR